ncbi:hypothetical protein PRZ48_010521 [Zasmidium cellare]|uniref:Uncharacterized protein n=1 Tax=Zasmidium cellare TaxID=395010 RepID=A0ABR0E8X1_ZASCE|nr:hypothetical protein PRZ48_010521 [Zasmidium cellare]
MAFLVNTNSYEDILAQVRTNLKICGHADVTRLELTTTFSNVMGGYCVAWLTERYSEGSYKIVMQGPSCPTRDEALEALLRSTSEMVTVVKPGMFEQFHQQGGIHIGNALVLERFQHDLDAARRN